MSSAPAPEPNSRRIVEVDARGRASLGKLVLPGQFVATQGADGSLLLEPAVVTTALEASLRANPDVHDQVTRALKDLDSAAPARRRR